MFLFIRKISSSSGCYVHSSNAPITQNVKRFEVVSLITCHLMNVPALPLSIPHPCTLIVSDCVVLIACSVCHLQEGLGDNEALGKTLLLLSGQLRRTAVGLSMHSTDNGSGKSTLLYTYFIFCMTSHAVTAIK